MIGRVGAIMFNSDKHAEMAKWYGEMLGFPTPEAWGDDHFGTTNAETYFGFNQAPDGAPIVLYFQSEDVDGDFAAIKARGATVKAEPQDWDWGGHAAAFTDPAGNQVWIYKMLPGAQ